MDNFEKMLSGEQGRTFKTNKIVNNTEKNTLSKHLKNGRSCNIYDFIKIVNKLVAKIMPDVIFETDEGRNLLSQADTKIDNIYITYKLIDRTSFKELKPIIRENISAIDKYENRTAEIYGQKFKNIIQFNIFANTCENANKVLEQFEELMLTYVGYFQKNGVSQVLFKKQFTDDAYTILRQNISIRNIQYYVVTENIKVIFKEKIDNIEKILNEVKEE